MLRTPENYDHQCNLLESHYNQQDSVHYGINYHSELNKISGFHVANSQLPQDITHILFEGVLPLEIKLLLHNMIYGKKLFSLTFLNQRIQHFIYGYPETKNKPSKDIEDKHIRGDSKLPFSGNYNNAYTNYIHVILKNINLIFKIETLLFYFNICSFSNVVFCYCPPFIDWRCSSL